MKKTLIALALGALSIGYSPKAQAENWVEIPETRDSCVDTDTISRKGNAVRFWHSGTYRNSFEYEGKEIVHYRRLVDIDIFNRKISISFIAIYDSEGDYVRSFEYKPHYQPIIPGTIDEGLLEFVGKLSGSKQNNH